MINKSYQKVDNGAVVHTDENEFKKYKLKRAAVLREKNLEQKVIKLEKRIDFLESKIRQLITE